MSIQRNDERNHARTEMRFQDPGGGRFCIPPLGTNSIVPVQNPPSQTLAKPHFSPCAALNFSPAKVRQPREPGNREFGTKLGRQKTGRKPNLLKTTKFLSSLVQMHFQEFNLASQKPSVFRLTPHACKPRNRFSF